MESLSGQTLAVDASIWLTQFVKAMRDPEDGTMMRNAHLLGTFYRISKLLTHGIRPVFVFDGDTPAIKLKTLQQRRSRREKSQDTLTQTAKKLLIKQQREKGSKQLPPSEVPRSPAAKPVEAFQYDAMSSEEKSADDGNDSDYDATWMVDAENFEAYQRDRRQDARETFLTLAGKPEEYSMAQISTFLKASKLKRDMNSRKSAIDSPESGRRIASEGGRRYIYTKASAPHALDESSVGRSSEHVRIQAAKSVDATAKQDGAVFSPTTLDTKHPSWFSAGKRDAPVVLDWATDEVSVKCDLPNAFKLDAPPSDLAHETSKQSSHDDHTPVQAKAASTLPSALDESEADLRKLRNQKLRDVDGVTDEMKSQVMDLLRLFGVPFVVCPMEAEAQCATLEQLGLVQGIITDDR
ncbi:hypothetical protein DYB35_009396 [Aphanomyces astaci]|uniref:XPG N-terminal domain-containing protein n=1 Tax=Aphanomyces astaci TaxID=112090 RepID=A0A418CZ65_APHAT|nr:hypothetical protein DYB35_009396 [Aphanomyces astaci]